MKTESQEIKHSCGHTEKYDNNTYGILSNMSAVHGIDFSLGKCFTCINNDYDSIDKGKKFDQEKPRWSLMPFKQLSDVVKVLTAGAKKYDDYNWQKIDNGKDRYFSASMRHFVAWRSGEKLDPETGLPHLAHAVCNLLFLMWFDDEKSKTMNLHQMLVVPKNSPLLKTEKSEQGNKP